LPEGKVQMSRRNDVGPTGSPGLCENGSVVSLRVFLVVLVAAVCGCDQQGQAPGTNIIEWPGGQLSKKEAQAVDLYVDAVMHKELNEDEQALQKLNAAVQLNDRYYLAYSLLGQIYQQMKEYEKSAVMERFALAVKAYVRACELRPDHFGAHLGAAESFYKLEDYDQAIAYGEKAAEIDPNVIDVQKLLGDVYESQKDHEQAIAAYKRALEVDSNNPEIMTALAVVYLRSNRQGYAEELLSSVVKMQPDNGQAYKYLGYCYLLLKDIDKSVESYSRAIEINQNDWDAHRGLGVAYILKGTAEDGSIDEQLRAQALKHWRRSLQIKPDQPKLTKLLQKYTR